jgi:hypothetical protein
MKTLLILAVSALCVFSAKADDDYATIVRYLGESGRYIISPDDVAKVQAFMKAKGYQHVSEIPKGVIVVPLVTPYESIPAEMKGILDQLKYIDMEASAEHQKYMSSSAELDSLSQRMDALPHESFGPGGADLIADQMKSLSNQFSQKVKDCGAARQRCISLLLSESPLIERMGVLAVASGNPSAMQEAKKVNENYTELLATIQASLR